MRRASLTRRVLAAGGAASLALAVASPSGAAARPAATGWSLSQTVGPAEGEWANTLAADSASDAWSTWYACTSCSGKQVTVSLLEHWTGSAWSQVTVPASLAKYAKDPLATGASSASNAWLFNQHNVLRWNGTTWTLAAIPKWVARFNLSGDIGINTPVFSPSDVWVFSLGIDSTTDPQTFAARYNGTGWSKVNLPGIPSGTSALAPNDIWELGVTTASVLKGKRDYILMHWNGTSWSTVPLPKVTPPKGATESPGAGFVATGPSDVWLPWDIEQGTQGAQTLYLLHWNGTSWAKVDLKLPTSGVDAMAQDGNGGLWLVTNGPAPSYTWYLDHLSSSGTWTRDTVPSTGSMTFQQLTGITWVPGTSSLWAQGDLTSGNNIYGATFQYTP
jgi:hypothetical protein